LNSELQNNDAFLELVAENRPKILKVCRVYAWHRSDQEDLYQEILCQVWRALPNLKQEAHVNSWLYRIALNTAISFVRKDKTHRTHVVEGTEEQLHDIPAEVSRDPRTDEQLSRLFQAISKLSDTEKAVITLFLEELSYEQMASVLGISESNVGVLLHRAKKKLSTLMKEAP